MSRATFRDLAPGLAVLFALLMAGCASVERSASPSSIPAASNPSPLATPDEFSYARPDQAVIRHLSLDLTLDFEERTLAGTATLALEWKAADGRELVLDTRDLEIGAVDATHDGRSWVPAAAELAAPDPMLGQKLTVRFSKRSPRKVRLAYRTSPKASGLQWLAPALTLGKQTPMLFSQSQPFHARSWVPIQDTPAVRFTYEAHVTTPKDIQVLMSADNDPKAARDGDYRFRMPQPIPAYLLAIAAGDLVFQAITPRIGIWAEPAMVRRAADEFVDTGKMMEVAERLYGRYRWGRYDILVLPPSFPYGGMENPRLTFASPTVITGDRSLVSLVAHELAHSWSGNLVTCAANRDMWLNEGFTTYVENRIVEQLYGRDFADMQSITARRTLEKECTEANLPLQSLVLPPGRLPHPEDYLRGVVYAKGAWFLQFLEQRFGRPIFDRFLRDYFERFAFQSVSSEIFVAHARDHLFTLAPGRVTDDEFNAWLHQPGIPANAPRLDSPRLRAVDTARSSWLNAGTLPPNSTTTNWVTQEWLHFLVGLPAALKPDQLGKLDAAYHFTGTPNVELANVWYPLTIRSGYLQARPAIEEYLTRVGRRRTVLPTYRALAETPETRAWGQSILARARSGLHPITIRAAEDALSKPAHRPAP